MKTKLGNSNHNPLPPDNYSTIHTYPPWSGNQGRGLDVRGRGGRERGRGRGDFREKIQHFTAKRMVHAPIQANIVNTLEKTTNQTQLSQIEWEAIHTSVSLQLIDYSG